MTPAQSAGLEQRARELLAQEYEREYMTLGADDVRIADRLNLLEDRMAIRAIVAALAAPAADGVRLEYVINQMPLSEFNTWLGTGLEWDGDKAPTLAQIRDAIDSVMPAAPQAQGEG